MITFGSFAIARSGCSSKIDLTSVDPQRPEPTMNTGELPIIEIGCPEAPRDKARDEGTAPPGYTDASRNISSCQISIIARHQRRCPWSAFPSMCSAT